MLQSQNLYLLASLLTAFALGKLLAWLILRPRIDAAAASARAEGHSALAVLQERLSGSEAERDRLEDRLAEARELAEGLRRELQASGDGLARVSERADRLPVLERDLEAARAQRVELDRKLAQAQSDIATLNTRLDAEREQAAGKLALLGEAREQLTEQFKNLAAEILEDKSKRFTEQNQVNLGLLLDPLRTRITEFQLKVEQVYETEGKERAALSENLKQLFSLNQQVSKETNDLTRALKGSAKTQGNWGEMVLERVLEMAGLRKGQEYDTQESHQREDGSRAQPDVIIRLPEERNLVIDAKVSLTAYEDYASADEGHAREAALKRHLDSVRSHVKGLSERNYQQLHGLDSFDFVLMFVAVEPAFMLAVTEDRELFQQAWSRNVMLVSPSTLLFVLRTVAHLWRQDAQNRNALEIAKRGSELYDKLVGFVESLDSIGNRLSQAQRDFDTAKSRLTGKGGAVRQAEMLRELGVKPGKAMPAALLALPEEDGPEGVG
jgi:DNA recombination protein RmuC